MVENLYSGSRKSQGNLFMNSALMSLFPNPMADSASHVSWRCASAITSHKLVFGIKCAK